MRGASSGLEGGNAPVKSVLLVWFVRGTVMRAPRGYPGLFCWSTECWHGGCGPANDAILLCCAVLQHMYRVLCCAGEYRPEEVASVANEAARKAQVARYGVFGANAPRFAAKPPDEASPSSPGPGEYNPPVAPKRPGPKRDTAVSGTWEGKGTTGWEGLGTLPGREVAALSRWVRCAGSGGGGRGRVSRVVGSTCYGCLAQGPPFGQLDAGWPDYKPGRTCLGAPIPSQSH